jgi:hypothetical protein
MRGELGPSQVIGISSGYFLISSSPWLKLTLMIE